VAAPSVVEDELGNAIGVRSREEHARSRRLRPAENRRLVAPNVVQYGPDVVHPGLDREPPRPVREADAARIDDDEPSLAG